MNTRDESAVSDVSEQTEQVQAGSEQLTNSTAEPSFAEALLRTAIEDGHVIGPQPNADTETKVEPEAIAEETEIVPEAETKAEPETEVEAEEEVKPEAKKGDKLVPLAEVLEERAKKNRAKERAERAEALAAQLQAQLTQSVAPQPTEDNPFGDVQDVSALDRLERSYEKTIDLADENPDGAVDVVIGHKDGKEIRKDFTPEELVVLRKKADKAIRKFIPEHRTYLQQRAVADAQAIEVYPELKDPDSEFTKAAAYLAQRLLNGQAQKDPSLLVWIGHAVSGYQAAVKRNGNGAAQAVTTPAAKRIVESSKTQIAPAPVKTRSFVERRTSSASVEKAEKKFEETRTHEAAEELLAAKFAQRSGNSNRLEPIAE